MAKTKKKSSKEDKLAKDRLRKKEEYTKIKNDPELYNIQKEKERKRYLLKKEKNKIQSIKGMSTRAQREQRRRWRENSRKYSKKKEEQRKIQRILLENSPPDTDNDDNNIPDVLEPAQRDPNLDPLADESKPNPVEAKRNVRCTCNTSASARKIRYKAMKVIKNLRDEIDKLKKEKDILRKRRKKLDLQEEQKNKTLEDTLEKKVDMLLRDIQEDKVEEVKKKLLFNESLSRGLNEKYKSLKKTEKRSFVQDVMLKNETNLKKYKVKGRVPFTVRKKLYNAREDRTNNLKLKIKAFFEDDINSSVAPGKNEFVKRRGVRTQKRYLTDNLKNLHNKYCKEQGNVSYATFCKYRPYWLVFPDGKRETCLCKLHCNANLLLKYLKMAKITTQGTVTEMLASLCCDSSNENCLKRTCDDCKHKRLNYEEFDNTTNIKYKKWIVEKKTYLGKNGKQSMATTTTKKMFEEKPRNLILKLEDTIDVLFKHTRNIVVQTSTIKELKQNLTDAEVLIHVDFSENYSLKFHEEVQSFHFGGSRGQISLHTVVLYYVDSKTGLVSTKSICTMSQCLNHDASSIWSHIIPVLNTAKELVPLLSKIHFLSDSPSSQYRNRFIFYMITMLRHQVPRLDTVTWNYQEAGHGKGAPDGIGAVVKRTADSHVKFGGDVGSFQDFQKVLRKEIKNVDLIVIPEDEVSRKKFPENVPGFKGTTKVHQAIWSSSLPYSVALRSLSCFSCKDSYLPCEHGKHLGVLSTAIDKVATCQSTAHDNIDVEINFENGSTLQIDSPTIFNNIDDSMILNEFDGTFLDEIVPLPSVSAEKKGKDSSIKILSNVPFDYTRFKLRSSMTQAFDIQQREFQNFLQSPPSNNNNVSYHKTAMDVCKDIVNVDQVEIEKSDYAKADPGKQEHETLTSMDIDQNKENIDITLKYSFDDWVIVQYHIKSKIHYFIGKILKKDEVTHEYNVSFLKKAQGKITKFGWPTISDDDLVNESKIIQRLQEPEENRRGQFVFKDLPKLNFK